MRPLIGIPCHAGYRQGTGRPIYCNNRTYTHAVESAGGIPVLIPMLNDLIALESLLVRLDGVLFAGGVDIQPCLYHEGVHARLDEADPRLDQLESTLMQLALQDDMPILGICRGMQLLNVVLGGNLYQDLDEQYPGSLGHCRRELPRNMLMHRVHVEAGSRMEAILGTNEMRVNTLHHQAVKEPGKDVHISGRAEDGVAELLEVSNYRFVMGVQGHPEEIYTEEPTSARLFSAFVQACSDHSGSSLFSKLEKDEEITVNA